MVSTLNGPIPPHPYYDKTNTRSYLNIPAQRVRPEGQDYAQQGRGTVCLGLEIEGHSMPASFRRSKTDIKDHFKENVRWLRQIQREFQNKEVETKQPVKALWKSSKYENIESKIKDEVEKLTLAPRPQSANNFLRAHSRTGFLPQSARPASVEPPGDKLTVPKAATARDINIVRHDIDFVKVNGCAAKRFQIKKSPSMTALDDVKKQVDTDEKMHRKGEVPKYLVERKMQWQKEAEEQRASRPDPDMPPGHRLMPEAERRETLMEIKKKQEELMQELSSMPIRNDTTRIRRHREEVEQKLSKIEEAIKIFSRSKVFVKLES